MKCPSCRSSQTQVVDSRIREAIDSVYRRRRCLECWTAWTTYEVTEDSFNQVRLVIAMRHTIDKLTADLAKFLDY